MSEQRRPHDAAYFAEQEDSFLAEDIVHALDASVAQSVNQALAVALQPIARQLKRYALTAPPDGNPRPLSSAGPQGSDSPTQHPWPVRPNLSIPATTNIHRKRPPAPKPFPTPPNDASDASCSSQSDSDDDSLPHKHHKHSSDEQHGPHTLF
ncbi:hypothetical protein NDU88_000078 [Pleurodeles waltl]|uniref:Uncharacterized protein n=1 Tax=Pleurodeles waltl TaxID=8319 RepID=A0AAV7U3B8_PLEWA|nr:hypothetical protein NDU88_000078 [Pleurodeles waltl]